MGRTDGVRTATTQATACAIAGALVFCVLSMITMYLFNDDNRSNSDNRVNRKFNDYYTLFEGEEETLRDLACEDLFEGLQDMAYA